jgi:cellulose synthase/poly-beta-1,6-N-acetylglucosamine synthase-like glycosyltransferase
MIQDLLIHFVFWVVGIVSGYFSLRMIAMFLIRSFEKRRERKNSTFLPILRQDIFFSILIPARNEASVIKNTLTKMCKIQFPLNQFEIFVITDGKEKSDGEELTTFEKTAQFIEQHKLEKLPTIHLLSVPEGFDGKVNGVTHNYSVNSTKGRALNYCMSQIKSKGPFHMLSFFDAESHPDPSILSKLSIQLSLEETPSVYQGPLFQVRNFWKISLFTKVVSLTQAFSHEYSLPMILKWIPFLGGTNMHIPLSMMMEVKGFSNTTITEDLELGVRLNLHKNVKPKFIDVPSSEQTPATIKGYFYQRSRWGGGNVETLNQIYLMILDVKDRKWKTNLELSSKDYGWKAKLKTLFIKLCLYGPGEWITYFSVGLIIVTSYLGFLWKSLHIFANLFSFSYHFFPYILILGIRILVTLPMLISGCFIILLYFKYGSFIEEAWSPFHLLQLIFVFCFAVVILPFIGWMYAFPFVYACFSHWLGFTQKVWVKTERSIEA